MQALNENKLIIHASIFIALLFNSFKLLALREGAYIAQYWTFNGYELFFQAVWNFIICWIFGIITLKIISLPIKEWWKRLALQIPATAVLYLVIIIIGVAVQRRIFNNPTDPKVFFVTYSLRIFASIVLMAILLRIILLLREGRKKDEENQQLRTAYLDAQLQLLKEQLNPHFFFNALTSLSSIAREDPLQAQKYISHLSKVFRYALSKDGDHITTLQQEMVILDSYIQLQKMRLEDGLVVNINIPANNMEKQLPNMSLQPLLENAVKHNTASSKKPLVIDIFTEGDFVIVKNNLQANNLPGEGNGIGLTNLEERCKILLQKKIGIIKTADAFIVKVPLT